MKVKWFSAFFLWFFLFLCFSDKVLGEQRIERTITETGNEEKREDLSSEELKKLHKLEMQKDVNDTDNFDVGPTDFSIETERGKEIKKIVQITNREGEDWVFDVGVEDFQGSSDPNQTVLLQGDKAGKYGAKDWFSLETEKFSLKHGERGFLEVIIKIPENADAGDHYASVLVSASPKDLKEGTVEAPVVNITSRAGVLFFIRVKGDIKEEGHLSSFLSDKKFYYNDKLLSKKEGGKLAPVKFKIIYENKGSVRLRPEGEIEIKNWRGKVVKNIKVEAFNVLRESMRGVELGWNWHEGGFYFGPHKAFLKLKNSYNNEVEEREASFWMIPWKTIMLVLVGIIGVWIIVRFFKKTFSFKLERKK